MVLVLLFVFLITDLTFHMVNLQGAVRFSYAYYI